ncbi:hypothetical protein GCM10020229_45150 [Kitasatospora albolonga]
MRDRGVWAQAAATARGQPPAPDQSGPGAEEPSGAAAASRTRTAEPKEAATAPAGAPGVVGRVRVGAVRVAER